MADTRNIQAAGPTRSDHVATEANEPTANQPTANEPTANEPTAWVGMVLFAGVLLVMVGAFQAIMGLVALLDREYYLVTKNGLLVSIDFTAWGWTHLIIGLVAIGTGVGLMLGQMWARVLGIIIAVLSAIVNVLFISAYPVWSTIVIAVDVLAVYALAVHGKEVQG